MPELTDNLRPDLVFDVSPGTKAEVFAHLLNAATAAGLPLPARVLLDRLLDRERQAPTALGRGLAIPHATVDDLAEMCVILGFCAAGAHFDTPDDEPVRLLFVVLLPRGRGHYLQLLAQLAAVARDDALHDRLAHAANAREAYALLTAP